MATMGSSEEGSSMPATLAEELRTDPPHKHHGKEDAPLSTDANADDANETTPLLIPPNQTTLPRNEDPDKTTVDNPNPLSLFRSGTKHQVRTLLILTISFEILFLGLQSVSSAYIRLIEAVICRNYYENLQPGTSGNFLGAGGMWMSNVTGTGWNGLTGGIPEEECKLDVIQDKVAYLMGWEVLLECMPTLLFGIPFSILASRVGKKYVVAAGMAGIALASAYTLAIGYLRLPIEVVLFAFVFMCIGGGPQTISAMVWTMVAEVVPASQRASVFFMFTAILELPQIVSPAIGSALLTYSIWLPYLFGISTTLLSIPFVLALPGKGGKEEETNEAVGASDNTETNASASSATASVSGCGTAGSDGDDDVARAKKTQGIQEGQENESRNGWEPHNHHPIETVRAVALYMSSHLTVIFLVLVWGVALLATIFTSVILLQFASKKFHWSLARAGLLLSFNSLSRTILLLVLLPIISTWMLKSLKMSVEVKDLWILRVSSIIELVGLTCIGFAPAPPLLLAGLCFTALGSGFRAALRSVLTSLVEAKYLTLLYTTLAVVDTVSMMLSGPMLTNLLRAGIKLGGTWMGLPFLIMSVFYLVMVIPVVFLVKAGRTKEDIQSTDEEAEPLLSTDH
ncbi:hypothetical protein MMC25_004387 [Agyrium rufum]|nr:hypothetical protein [Agyrium rufum]